MRSGRSWVPGIVEGVAVEPETVESATQAIPLRACEETTVLEVGLPFFAWIEDFPLLGGITN